MQLDKYFELQLTSISDLYFYLRAKLRKVRLGIDVLAWGISPSKYFNKSVKNCADYVKENYKDRVTLPKTVPNTFQI